MSYSTTETRTGYGRSRLLEFDINTGFSLYVESLETSWFDFDHYYSDEAFPDALKIVFNPVSESSETPKQRKNRLYQLALDRAKQKLLANSQVCFLIEKLGATLSKKRITLT